jgi:restriction system protein
MHRRAGLLDDLMEIAGRLPWGVGVAVAVGLYILLHALASTTPAPATSTALLGSFVIRQFLWIVASILQYALPLALLFGAVVSYAGRRRNGILLADAAADPRRSIDSLSWQDFERLIGASYERQGFSVTRTGGGGADGGVDLVLTKGRESTLVQCKQWRAQKVGVTTVRELYGVMAARGAARGMVVSAGDFTPDAREFATGRNISLVTGGALAAMLDEVGAGREARVSVAAPACPRCGSRMVERVARKGSNPGQTFWGCETFPRCSATSSMI